MIQAIGLTSEPRRELPPAVDDLSFEAAPGRVTVLLGAHGAGKTTALRLMLQLERGRGVALFRGRPLHRVPNPARELGVILGDVPGLPTRTARGHLRMLSAAAGVPADRADDVLDLVGLSGLADQRLGEFSRGMDRRLGLAAALLGDPHTLLLDEPCEGVSPRESAWLNGLLRGYAAQGGAVLVTSADPKEAARLGDRVVTIDSGRLVADQDAADFARTRLRRRVAVHSPHADRLAALIVDEWQRAHRGTDPAADRAIEVVRESGSRIAVYGSTCAAVGDTAFRHGILVHRLAEEVGDTAPITPLPRADGRRPTPRTASAPHPKTATRPHTGAKAALRPEPHTAPDTTPRTEPRTEAAPRLHADAEAALRAEAGPDSRIASGTAPRAGSRAEPRAEVAPRPHAETALCAEAGSGPRIASGAEPRAGSEAEPRAEVAPRPHAETALCAEAGSGPRIASGAEPRAGSEAEPRTEVAPRPHDRAAADLRVEAGSGPRIASGAEPRAESEAEPCTEVAPRPHDRAEAALRVEAGAQPRIAAGSPPRPEAGAGARLEGSARPRAEGGAGPLADAQVRSRSEVGAGSRTRVRPRIEAVAAPGSPAKSVEAAASASAPRVVRRVPAGRAAVDGPKRLVIPRLPAPGPAWPVRYEVRRAVGDRSGVLAAVVSLVVSLGLALWLARGGSASPMRVLAGWPVQLPFPAGALGAGLIGALSFGQEFRYPALAPERGTVPRRLGLLVAKLLVSGGVAVLLAVTVLVLDGALVRVLYGPQALTRPDNWLVLVVGWVALMVGCAWAGTLAAGVFRSTTTGLAAVLAVPVLVVPLVQRVLDEPAARSLAGVPGRLRSLAFVKWPSGVDQGVSAVVRLVAQPVGGALALSLAALVCAYVLTALRSKAR